MRCFAVTKALDVFAPDCCNKCFKLGKPLCDECSEVLFFEPKSVCFRCNSISENYKTCRNCRALLKVSSLMYVSHYQEDVRRLIHQMKITASRSTAKYFGLLLDELLPYFEADLVSYVPASPQKIRERGFDHAKIIAAAFAEKRGLEIARVVSRKSNRVQKFLTLKERKKISPDDFLLKKIDIKGLRILLIDDVVTSGYTLRAVNMLLKRERPKSVVCAVVAKN